jgi:hypothetical protein
MSGLFLAILCGAGALSILGAGIWAKFHGVPAEWDDDEREYQNAIK